MQFEFNVSRSHNISVIATKSILKKYGVVHLRKFGPSYSLFTFTGTKHKANQARKHLQERGLTASICKGYSSISSKTYMSRYRASKKGK